MRAYRQPMQLHPSQLAGFQVLHYRPNDPETGGHTEYYPVFDAARDVETGRLFPLSFAPIVEAGAPVPGDPDEYEVHVGLLFPNGELLALEGHRGGDYFFSSQAWRDSINGG